jgi:hypothetical protein
MSRPYWWFQGATVAALRERLNAASPDAVLEVHLNGEKMTLDVVEPDAARGEERVTALNESFICPPVCP